MPYLVSCFNYTGEDPRTPYESGLQDKAAPRFQYAIEAVPARCKQNAPAPEESFETPPKRARQVALALNHSPSQK